ncbi:MAG TPA: ATP-binding protein, partial [Verrucomicrobiae bacterium]|nr:ATP-binding protein [Verrucomicrobiae bacterium]
MNDQDAELLAKLLPIFRGEAEEHLLKLEEILSAMEEQGAPVRADEALREVHSLKGAARAVAAHELETLCQETEEVFARLRKGGAVTAALLEALRAAADLAADLAQVAGKETPEGARRRLVALLPALAAVRGEAPPPQVEPAAAPVQAPAAAAELPAPPSSPPTAPEGLRTPETVRVSAGVLERLLLQTEELLAEKLSASRHAASLRSVEEAAARAQRTLETALAALSANAAAAEQPLLRGAVRGAEESLAALTRDLRLLQREGEEGARSLQAKVDELAGVVRETLMLPAAGLLEQFPRMVRELARDVGKEAELATSGGAILLDRRMLEELRDPFLHLLRNCVGHGIESPQERAAAGKPARGRITVGASTPAPGRVLFTVSDDGRGLDLGRLRKKAVQEGRITREEAEGLDLEGVASLVFLSGLSTREEVGAVSGRGVGLSIVREKVERLGGAVSVSTRRGEGTVFRLEIPAAVPAFRGVQVRLQRARYIFPAYAVEKVFHVDRARVSAVGSRETVLVEGRQAPVVRLEEPLRLPLRMALRGEESTAVLVGARFGGIAYAVDEVIGEEEFVVKGLGKQLRRVPCLAGSTVFPDGTIAFILDPAGLLSETGGATPPVPAAAQGPEPRKRVLVVEDS